MSYELKLSITDAKRLIKPIITFGSIKEESSFREETDDFLDKSDIGFIMKYVIVNITTNEEIEKTLSFPGPRLTYMDRLYLRYDSIRLIFDSKEDALLFKMSCL